MSALEILKKEDGYWLSIDGKTKALINIVSHSPMVLKAIEEAVSENELASLRQRTEWQPIETCPENKVVLVAWDRGYEIQVEQAEKINGFFGSVWGLSREFEPTHWMPLPELP